MIDTILFILLILAFFVMLFITWDWYSIIKDFYDDNSEDTPNSYSS